MSVYHIVFLWLLLCAVVEHIKNKTPRYLFLFTFILLTVFLCIRFGQGQDYFSYASIYRTLTGNFFQDTFHSTVHSEIGWKALCSVFLSLKLEFPVFVFVLSLYMMALLLRFLRLFCGQRKMFALMLGYHTLYLTYCMSTLRQGVVAVTFLGLLLPLLLNKNYIKYLTGVLILSLIHSVALVLAILPLVAILRLKIKHCVALVAIGCLLGVLLAYIDIGVILKNILSIVYLGESDLSVFAALERFISFAVVTFCYYTYQQGREPDQKDPLCVLYKVYAIGIFLYGMLMFSSLISSRTVYALKTVEIALLCICITRCKKSRHIVFAYCMLLCAVMYVKNIDSYMDWGDYQNKSIWDYPYVTIFNQKDIIRFVPNTANYPFK